ncbi:MAG: hypothetical protein ACK5JR_02400 [Tropicimonas sp.]|uniref:hypothetical protein n=1 Tax=Tropicimonas sp. TaxID=2067044 RepID=UPI003A874B6A
MPVGRSLSGLLLMALAALPTGTALADGLVEQAYFELRDKVIAPDLQPFATSVSGIGNGSDLLANGGFEPVIYRTMFRTTEGAENRIITEPAILSNFDSWREGAMDGAEIEVLRIERGQFRSVRRDRVAQGGFHVSGWLDMTGKKIVPAGRNHFTVAFPGWFRKGVPYHFTVRALGAGGQVSEPAEWVAEEHVQGSDPLKDEPFADFEADKSAAGGPPATPANLRASRTADGLIRLDWDPVPGAAGYRVYRADLPPEEHKGHFLELEGAGPAIRAGDLVILRQQTLRADRARVLTNRVWDAGQFGRSFLHSMVAKWSDDPDGGDWHLEPHEAGSTLPDAGETFLRVTLGFGQKFPVGRWNHSGTAQSWYPVLEPGRDYRFEVWMRGKAARPVSFNVTGFHSRPEGGGIKPFLFRVTPDWQRFTGTFSVPAMNTGKEIGRMSLLLEGPGQFDVDNFRVYRDDAPYMALLPEDEERLGASGMGILRTHGFIKTKTRSYDLAQLTNPAGGSNAIEGGSSLPQILEQIDRLDMNPWLQVEPHFTAEEWLGLVEYLAAPFDPARDDPAALPWAAKRAAQGQAEPWSERFDSLHFEIGNETWNGLFRPWIFQEMEDAETGQRYKRGEVYGLYQEYVLAILRQSPHWERLAPRVTTVVGGQAGISRSSFFDYGMDAARMSPGTQLLSHAAYIGGWEAKEGPVQPTPEGLSGVLTHVLQLGLPLAERHVDAARRISRQNDTPLTAGTYEAGPGYAMNGLNGQRVTPEQSQLQMQAMKSAAAGTAVLDSFLAQARQGMTLQTYFLYGAGDYWSSHEKWTNGGQTQPAWDLLALFNRVGTGDMLDIRTRAVPTASLPEGRNRRAIRKAPLVDAYATRDGDRVTLILVSRRVPGYPDPGDDGNTAVTVDLPFASAGRVTRHVQTGAWNSTNLKGREVSLVAEDVPPTDVLPQLTLPVLKPGSTVFYVFEGVR